MLTVLSNRIGDVAFLVFTDRIPFHPFTKSHMEYDREFTGVVLLAPDAQSSHKYKGYQSTQEQGGAECEGAMFNNRLTETEFT
jgi:hypothetical protein